MPLKNNRNSRDDKSSKNRYSKPSNSSDFKNNRTGKVEDPNSTKKKMFDADKSRPFKGNSSRSEDRPYKKQFNDDADKANTFKTGTNKTEERPYKKRFGNDTERRSTFKTGANTSEDRPYKKRYNDESEKRSSFKGRSDQPEEKSYKSTRFGDRKPSAEGSKRGNSDNKFERKAPSTGFSSRRYDDPEKRKWTSEEQLNSRTLRGKKEAPAKADDGLIRLNRYIANAGICSRRKADELIQAGVVSVNGEVISELGHKVDPGKDVIRYNGETLKREKMVYVLLNKPKDYITTTEDPQERRTVMHLVEKASRERIYPVGRLDRNTTGLLLMTNDGDLAEKLSHPRNNITKIYQVELNKNLTQGDLNKIEYGLELEDGLIKPDVVSYVQGGSKREIGIQIHSGKNRIVRRIFEHLGYDVVKLDRVVYGNLTKKDLPRGRWRYLEEKEVIQLKHLIK